MLVKLVSNAKASGYRRESVDGVDYLVVPMTMLVEGVHPGSEGPLYYPEAQLKATAAGWNNMPLVLNHTTDLSGQLVSARGPDQLSKHLGLVLNATYTDGLKAEAWFIEAKLDTADARLKAAILAGTPVSVSTGLIVNELDKEPGAFGGTAYTATVKAFQPDHLAVLLDQPGACSQAAGCGLMVGNADQTAQVLANSDPELVANATGRSFDETQDLIRKALKESLPHEYSGYLEAVFPKSFVYYFREKFWEQAYTISGDYASLMGVPEEVVRKVSFQKPVTVVGNQMNKAQLIAAIVANGAFATAEDKTWLESLPEARLAQLLPKAPEAPATPTPVANAGGCGCGGTPAPVATAPAATPGTPVANAQAPAAPAMTPDQWMKLAPPEVQQMVADINAQNAAERASLTQVIVGNALNTFTQDQLNTMALPTLRGLAKMAAAPAMPTLAQLTANYSGAAGYAPQVSAPAAGTQVANGGQAPKREALRPLSTLD